MRLILAPMEGVVDVTMRDLLTRGGHFDRCVTEFVRITDQQLPAKVFKRTCPELVPNDAYPERALGTTPAGTPVYLQLLGGSPEWMAVNAEKAAQLGAPGIDLNFGCPSKCTNRNNGGSVLLKEPERVHNIVKAVREAVPSDIPVTVKIRLGFLDDSLFEDTALGVQAAHASELCIHARTKQQGYQPPAYWMTIGKIRQQLTLPVIANGEIWTPDDARQAQLESGCNDLMIGRGALSRPDLAAAIKADQTGRTHAAITWEHARTLLDEYSEHLDARAPKYAASFIKQWLTYLRRQYPEAEALFQHIKRMKTVNDIRAAMFNTEQTGT